MKKFLSLAGLGLVACTALSACAFGCSRGDFIKELKNSDAKFNSMSYTKVHVTQESKTKSGTEKIGFTVNVVSQNSGVTLGTNISYDQGTTASDALGLSLTFVVFMQLTEEIVDLIAPETNLQDTITYKKGFEMVINVKSDDQTTNMTWGAANMNLLSVKATTATGTSTLTAKWSK